MYRDLLAEFDGRFEEILEGLAETTEDWLLEDIESFYCSRSQPADSAETMAQLQAALGTPLPQELQELWRQGAFEVKDNSRRGCLEVFSAARILELGTKRADWPNLYDTLCAYGSREEFEGRLNAEQIAVLRNEFFVFGIMHINDSDKEFLVFDRQQRFGTVLYGHDWHDFSGAEWWAEYGPLCEGHLAVQPLDELLSERIRQCIDDIGRRYAEDNW